MNETGVAFWSDRQSSQKVREMAAQVLSLPNHYLARSTIYPKDRLPFLFDGPTDVRNRSVVDRVAYLWTRQLSCSLDLIREDDSRVLIIDRQDHPDLGRVRSYAGPDLAHRIFTFGTYLGMQKERKEVRRYKWRRPFGYRYEGERLVIKSSEHETLKRMRRMRRRGVSIVKIGKTLNMGRHRVQKILNDSRYFDGTLEN